MGYGSRPTSSLRLFSSLLLQQPAKGQSGGLRTRLTFNSSSLRRPTLVDNPGRQHPRRTCFTKKPKTVSPLACRTEIPFRQGDTTWLLQWLHGSNSIREPIEHVHHRHTRVIGQEIRLSREAWPQRLYYKEGDSILFVCRELSFHLILAWKPRF